MEKAVLVEPENAENTGFIARLSANFDLELRIVSPEFNLSEARKTASNAQEKLREAEIYDSVEEAVEDLSYVVGTKPGRGRRLKSFSPNQDTSVMLGRESSGLKNSELELCDAVVHIETQGYHSLNLSHAAAIIFHSFSEKEESRGISPGQKEVLKQILPEKTLQTVLEANPTRQETDAIIGELKEKSD